MKPIYLIFLSILTGCSLFSSSNQIICHDNSKVCEYNQSVLSEEIKEFQAKGGAYYVIDMTTQEVISGANINIQTKENYHPNNIMKLFDYTSGMRNKEITIKDVEFNTSHPNGLDKISQNTKEEYYILLGLKGNITPINLLKSYAVLINSRESKDLIPLLRKNVKEGPAKRADAEGMNVHGLTSTEYKANGKDVITTFVGHFSKNGKDYALITILDEPKALKSTWGFNTAGWNAAKVTKNIILNINATH